MLCSDCKYGKKACQNQYECLNVESMFCGDLMDCDDSCEYWKKTKIIVKKEKEKINYIKDNDLEKRVQELATRLKKSEKPHISIEDGKKIDKDDKKVYGREACYVDGDDLELTELYFILCNDCMIARGESGEFRCFISKKQASKWCQKHNERGKLYSFMTVKVPGVFLKLAKENSVELIKLTRHHSLRQKRKGE